MLSGWPNVSHSWSPPTTPQFLVWLVENYADLWLGDKMTSKMMRMLIFIEDTNYTRSDLQTEGSSKD